MLRISNTAQGNFARCPDRFAMVGICTSGKTADCIFDEKLHYGIIQCAKFGVVDRSKEMPYSSRKRRAVEAIVQKTFDSTMFDMMASLTTFGGDYSASYSPGNMENGGFWWSAGECAMRDGNDCLEYVDSGISVDFAMPVHVS